VLQIFILQWIYLFWDEYIYRYRQKNCGILQWIFTTKSVMNIYLEITIHDKEFYKYYNFNPIWANFRWCLEKLIHIKKILRFIFVKNIYNKECLF
jgi:hypothetical protein